MITTNIIFIFEIPKVNSMFIMQNILYLNKNVTIFQPQEVERLEEAKLKAKFPNAMTGRGPGGHSAFLQKRLAKGVRFYYIV